MVPTEGIRMAGALKRLFHPTGTLYLSYSSPEAALQAIRGGLAQNDALTMPSGKRTSTRPSRRSRRPV